MDLIDDCHYVNQGRSQDLVRGEHSAKDYPIKIFGKFI